MLKIFKNHYLNKVNELYDYISEHIDDAKKIRGFLEYHKEMLLGMDQNIIKTTGPLDAIFFFYEKDYNNTIDKLNDPRLDDKQREAYQQVVFADKQLMASLSDNGYSVKQYYNELYINMSLLEKLNNKLDEEDRKDLDELYNGKRVLK